MKIPIAVAHMLAFLEDLVEKSIKSRSVKTMRSNQLFLKPYINQRKLFEIPLEKSEDIKVEDEKAETVEQKYIPAINIDLDDDELGLATNTNLNGQNEPKRFKFDIKTSIDLNRNYIQAKDTNEGINKKEISSLMNNKNVEEPGTMQEHQNTDSEEVVPKIKSRKGKIQKLAKAVSESSIVDNRQTNVVKPPMENYLFVDNRKKKGNKIIKDKRAAKS